MMMHPQSPSSCFLSLASSHLPYHLRPSSQREALPQGMSHQRCSLSIKVGLELLLMHRDKWRKAINIPTSSHQVVKGKPPQLSLGKDTGIGRRIKPRLHDRGNAILVNSSLDHQMQIKVPAPNNEKENKKMTTK